MHEIIVNFWNTHSDAILLYGWRLFLAIGIIVAGKIIIKISDRVTRKATGKFHFDETLASIFRMILRYGTIIVAGVLVLGAFGFNTTSLIAILGATGVALGLALKDALGNIAAGIILLFLRYYKKGDFIENGSALGTVREVDLFATILETPDGVFVALPNAGILGTPIRNYTRNGRRRMELAVTIAYSDSIETAFRTLEEIARAEPRFLADPPFQVMVKSLGDSGVNLMLRAWAGIDDYWDVFWEQSRNIKEKIHAAGLTIALPRRDVRILREEAVRPPGARPEGAQTADY